MFSTIKAYSPSGIPRTIPHTNENLTKYNAYVIKRQAKESVYKAQMAKLMQERELRRGELNEQPVNQVERLQSDRNNSGLLNLKVSKMETLKDDGISLQLRDNTQKKS